MSFTSVRAHAAGADGFSPPPFGGSLAVKTATLSFGDPADKNLFTLPAGAVVVDWMVDISTAFNAGTSNTIDLGIAGDDNYFADNLAAGSATTLRYGTAGTDRAPVFAAPLTTETQVQATYDQSGTAATAGLARVAMWYYVTNV